MSAAKHVLRAIGKWWLFVIEIVAIVATLVALSLAILQFRDQLLVNSWALLSTKASGNSGKIKALSYLASRGESLAGIDLSCRYMGGYGTREIDGQIKEVCVRRTFLKNVDLSKATHGKSVDLNNANLSEAHLFEAKLGHAWLNGANLTDTHLVETDLVGAVLKGADLSGADVSHANFADAQIDEKTKFVGTWAWDDRPPKNLDREVVLCVWKDGYDRWERPKDCNQRAQSEN